MKTAIVWFKTDLRITDNETLVKAISQNDTIIPVYCLRILILRPLLLGSKKQEVSERNF